MTGTDGATVTLAVMVWLGIALIMEIAYVTRKR